MDREKRLLHRIFYVMDKIALESDQSSNDVITYWTADPVEYQIAGLQSNPNVPNPREEVQIIEKLVSEGLLEVISNHGQYG